MLFVGLCFGVLCGGLVFGLDCCVVVLVVGLCGCRFGGYFCDLELRLLCF